MSNKELIFLVCSKPQFIYLKYFKDKSVMRSFPGVSTEKKLCDWVVPQISLIGLSFVNEPSLVIGGAVNFRVNPPFGS